MAAHADSADRHLLLLEAALISTIPGPLFFPLYPFPGVRKRKGWVTHGSNSLSQTRDRARECVRVREKELHGVFSALPALPACWLTTG